MQFLKQIKNAILVLITFIIMQIVVPMVATYILGTHGLSTNTAGDVSGQILNPNTLAVMMLAIYLLTIAALYGWRLLFPKTGLVRTPSRLYLAIPILLLMLVPLSFLEELLELPDNLSGTLEPLMNNWLGILCVAVAGPVTEELVFRRAILGSMLESKMKPGIAVLISAILFALIHFNWAQAPAAIIIGVIFGWLYVRTGSLVPSIVCHIINNGLCVVLATCAPADITLSSLLGSTLTAATVSAVCAAGAAWLIYIFNKKTRRGADVIEEKHYDEN